MDGNRFDNLTRTLAAGISRRTALKAATAGVLGALGLRAGAGAQVSQAQCGNVACKNNPGKCNPGCVCCVYGNGNSRCRPPGNCAGGAEVCPPERPFVDPARGCVQCLDASTCPAGSGPCQVATCTAGVCGFGPAGAGTPCRDAAGPCDIAEACDGIAQTCPVDAKVVNGTPCDADSDACTVDDTCQNGQCVAGLPRECRPCQTCSGGECVAVAVDSRCPAGCCGGICCRDDEDCVNEICQEQCVARGQACDSSGSGQPCCDQDAFCGLGPFDVCGQTSVCVSVTGGTCESDCECVGQLGTFPPPFTNSRCENGRCCAEVNKPCTNGEACCISGGQGLVCQTPSYGSFEDPICCIADGGACSAATFCCNGFCPNGFCDPVVCRTSGTACLADNQCCSRNCSVVCA